MCCSQRPRWLASHFLLASHHANRLINHHDMCWLTDFDFFSVCVLDTELRVFPVLGPPQDGQLPNQNDFSKRITVLFFCLCVGMQAVAGLVAVLYTVSIGLGIVGATLRSSRMLALASYLSSPDV